MTYTWPALYTSMGFRKIPSARPGHQHEVAYIPMEIAKVQLLMMGIQGTPDVKTSGAD